jgi:hypothetical protein
MDRARIRVRYYSGNAPPLGTNIMSATLEDRKLGRQRPGAHASAPTTMADLTVSPPFPGPPAHLHPRPRRWWTRACSRLDELLRLPANWDSYDADPLESQTVDSAKGLLECLGSVLDLPEPSVSPTRIGGVLLQWRSGTKEIEVELVSRDAASFAYADDATSEEDEGAVFREEPVGLNPVFKYLERLC